jgi:hypothetical protein
MSDWVSYNGKALGRIKLNDNGVNKFVFIAEGLEALATLFSIKPDEEIELDTYGKMPYIKFQQDYLKSISAFFPTLDEWLLKNEQGRSLDEHKR